MAANATAIWRVRPSGSNTNGSGFDIGIASYGTDYSQRNTPILSNIGTVTTATVTLTDTGASFTSALIGNGIYVHGTSITTTFTFITAVPSSTTLTLQTSPGAAGTAVTYNIGGGWADFWTNTTSTGPLVPGNIVYILGTSVPNPASYSFDYTLTGNWTPVNGNGTAGHVVFANDPSTPSYGAGGMPCISWYLLYQGSYFILSGLYFVQKNAQGDMVYGTASFEVIGCIFDQTSYDTTAVNFSSYVGGVIGCEIFSSTGGASTHANPAITGNYFKCIGNNIHDCNGPGVVVLSGDTVILQNVIAKNTGVGISYKNSSGAEVPVISNNTIDANTGSGISIVDQNSLSQIVIFNNIISNHVTGGTYGLTVGAGTAAANTLVVEFCDYNTFYNNTTNYNAINAGPHDTALGSNPYNAQTTEDYKLI